MKPDTLPARDTSDDQAANRKTAPDPRVAGSGELARPLDWYKDAVIYQLHVRSFFDSNGDGIGDFAGLTAKLDYVASLGVTAIWLLPFYPSPLRDEGYDIADYMNINPMYGSLDDFKRFLDAAHQLGLSVISELVINHTSDQHAWFQRARRAPKGSPERDFYVWSDTSDRYPEVRIIFQDFEPSNWTWDPLAQQYYWHRFYSHQPDLNFDNPVVRQTVLDIVDYWFGMGIDGVRLDAIPYLYERDGTNGESLPETHGFLKELRAHIDEHFPGRMLLAEANQWPDETAAYFGDDDECQMCFNFPLMPRLFMAVQQEERFPIVDILRHTPTPPPLSQWAIFLRNHDELTLEMVTEEERDAMYRFYATDPQSRVNLGLRRRLAPLLRNDRRRLELMHALLFSLPGTPVMYYGDEIRMGDNIYLRDRDSVRTPMQWSPDRNSGFSHANPQRLFLPTIVDPEYHYQSRNVETEEQSPHSFLWWLRRVLRLRARHRSFSRGTLRFLFPQNPRILAYLRESDGETILVVVNLSRLAQFVELDLAEFRGREPVELFGQTRFPQIGELPYLLSLGPHGFYWFRLDWPVGEEDRRAPCDLPHLRTAHDWLDLFQPPAVERTYDALTTHLVAQAWHQSPERVVRALEVQEVLPLPDKDADGASYAVVLVRVYYTEGEPALYQMALVAVGEQRAHDILRDRPTAGVLQVSVRHDGTQWYVCDATAERGFWERFVRHATASAAGSKQGKIVRSVIGDGAVLEARSHDGIHPLWRTSDTRGTVAAVANQLFLKMLRRVESGTHPEIEMTSTLEPQADKLPCPHLRGHWEHRQADGTRTALGIIYDFIAYERSLDDWCREDLRRALESASAGALQRAADPEAGPTTADTSAPPLASAQRTFALLGRRLAEVHNALADLETPASFAPEVVSTHYRRSLHLGFSSRAQRAVEQLREWVRRGGGDDADAAKRFLARADRIDGRFATLMEARTLLWRIRVHGALGLDEVLLQGDDLQLVDWGGDARRPFSERRIKRSAMVDLARLASSLHDLAFGVRADWVRHMQLTGDAADNLRAAEAAWRSACWQAFVAPYRAAVAGQLLVPDDDAEFTKMFDAFRLSAAMETLLQVVERKQTDRLAGALDDCLEQLPSE
jgi:maltose alpha-D-glucosyltransferase/alpha-amylase